MSKGRSFGVKRLPLAVPRRPSLLRSLHPSGIIWCWSGVSQRVMNSRTLLINGLLMSRWEDFARHIGRGVACGQTDWHLPHGPICLLFVRHSWASCPYQCDVRTEMRLATFKANGRVSYGAVSGSGIVDLG